MASTERRPLLTPDDVAAFLGVPKATLYAWRHRGEGPPALRVGRHIRYPQEPLDEWLSTRLEAS